MEPDAIEQVRETAPRARAVAADGAPDRRPSLVRLGDAVGNRTVTRLLARMGDGSGILPCGLVHPDVQAAIAASRGRGRPLDSQVSARLEPALGESLGEVRIHTSDRAAELARAVSARAFTVGNDIFFGSGEYRPGSRDGNGLIAHEVAHTIQQRGAPTTGPLTVSQPGDAMESEAEAVARDVAG